MLQAILCSKWVASGSLVPLLSIGKDGLNADRTGLRLSVSKFLRHWLRLDEIGMPVFGHDRDGMGVHQ